MGFPRAIERAEKEGDIEKMLLHELKHVRDSYFGINIGNLKITRENFRRKEISNEFHRCLGEVRACHYELQRICQDKQRGIKNWSTTLLFSVAAQYFKNYSKLGILASTPLEESIAKAQLEECKDIVPERIPAIELKSGVNEGFTLGVHISEKPFYLTILRGES
jgi:hypothetical protein